MKRRWLKLAALFTILIVLGAIVNVAVAWGCGMLRPGARGSSLYNTRGLAQNTWPVSVPLDWPCPSYVGQNRIFGSRILLAWKCDILDSESNHVQSIEPPYWKTLVLQAGLPLNSLQGYIEKFDLTDSAAGNISPNRSIRYVWLHRLPPRAGWIGRRMLHLLPTHPIWPGFLLNTLFYAGVLWLLLVGPRVLRRHYRRRRGLCPACAYPIGVSSVCTECGKPVKKSMKKTE